MEKKKLYIIGASGFGREILQWCKDINGEKQDFEICGFLDDNPNALDGYDCDYKVVGPVTGWQIEADHVFVIAIASPVVKRKIIESYESRNGRFISIIHPDAAIGSFNKIGKGVVICPGARITVNTNIGDYTTILYNTFIGHDASLGKYATVLGDTGINGHCQIGDGAFVGSHAFVFQGMKIGPWATVGAGSVVLRNVKAETKVFGNPARKFV